MAKNDLQGALDLLILKSLSHLGSMHGFGIILHIEHVSDELLNVEEGSLYPALHRMEQSGWVRAEWAVTESSRKAKFYTLTAAGRKQLAAREKNWEQVVKGVQTILRLAGGEVWVSSVVSGPWAGVRSWIARSKMSCASICGCTSTPMSRRG